ncbi:MAG: DNA polymerase III subunit delta' [Chloroflexi bacterium]|nr:DNA polymerase III subunit delta' [Chloroflexota bacterium]
MLNNAQGWPVAGHQWAVELLQRAAHNGPSHAYLFLGPRQVGKSTLARAFAQTLLCTNEGKRPCGECRACRLLEKGSYPDFRLIQPVDKAGAVDRLDGQIRTEQAADIIHDVALRPAEGRYKIFIIQDIHNANDSFANKLLKTLEEPPAHAIMCLTALDRSSVLPTIVSRCQIVELRSLEVQHVEQALCNQWQAEPAQAALLARLANGRLGWAVEQLKNTNTQKERIEQLQMLWRLVGADRIERLTMAEQMASNRNNQQLFGLLELWTLWWRDILLAQAGNFEACCNIDQQSQIVRQAALLPAQQVQRYLHTLKRIETYLHHTVNTRLALDVLLLQMPYTEEKT